jgi:hypothetical protein
MLFILKIYLIFNIFHHFAQKRCKSSNFQWNYTTPLLTFYKLVTNDLQQVAKNIHLGFICQDEEPI